MCFGLDDDEDVRFTQGGNEEANSSKDEDYDPQFDDEDYDHYGTEDEDWLEEAEMEAASKANTSRVGSKGHQSTVEEDLGHFSDDEDMFREVGSDDEQLQYAINSDGELEDVGIEFNPLTDMKKPKFCLGMKFADVKVLRDALREMAIQGGWEYVYIKNDKTKLRVVCKEDNYPFFLFASKMQHESTLQMKEYVSTHKCTRKFNNSMVRMRYLTAKFKDQIALNQELTPHSLAKIMSATIRARVSRSQNYRAKRAAMLEVEGSIREQYARLRDYGMELHRVDPATTIDIKCDFNNREKLPIFKRMYICLGALKEGFKAGCRAVIGLDGAHLKSCFGGQLLTAVGIDANNTSWVVAYAMVELETKDSWTWFLELLVKDLKIKFCARHLWTNFTKLFPGKVMKDQMWKAAKSTTLPYFIKEMEEMKSLDVDAYNWLTAPERPPKHWSRAYFRPGNNCDVLINNMCESFNGLVVHVRGKPPITMFEEIQMKLMRRVQRRKDKMAAYEGTICPKARKVIEKNKIKAAEDCISTFNGADQAEVENIKGSKNVVDLAARTCSCR
ncbi:uncharacterized protein LOC112194351 [Rosa chinensis]|uniref:uncharacterized protein LOC112194351 n=1 Tax=Rosa chinensis TaxID=74649 RepID=UPI001AD9059B|nr:uncharacterized protein LOC112194351 [Rosa chinensis]